MAKTSFNVTINPGTYTVPTGKYAVFSIFQANDSGSGGNTFRINGSDVLYRKADSAWLQCGPFAAKAGDVLSNHGGAAVGISGFLYDA